MKSMKLTKTEKKETAIPGPMTQDYPWGLCLNLDSEVMNKLGIKELPEVGGKMTLSAIVEVVSVGASASKESENRHMSLQVTDMELAAAKKRKADDEVLYG
jgi:hypothetical protein